MEKADEKLINTDSQAGEANGVLSETGPLGSAYDLSFLDHLGLHFLCLDIEHKPTFISTAAARFFELDSVDTTITGTVLIAPLIELAVRHQQEAAHSVLRLAGLSSTNLQPLSLKTARGTVHSVVAFAEQLLPEGDAPIQASDHDFQTVIFFYDLSPLDTVSMILKQARICRELYLDVIVQNLDIKQRARQSTDDSSSQTISLSENSFSTSVDEGVACDFVSSIHKAMQLLDHCILKSVSFTIKTGPSTLVAASESDLIKMVLEIVNQACEFVGVCGKLQLVTSVIANDKELPQASISLLAQRYSPLPNHIDPLAFFVYQHCLPHYFGKVTASTTAQSGLLGHLPLAPYLRPLSQVEASTSVVEEFREKLLTTISILSAHQGNLSIRCDSEDSLVFELRLPLATMTR